MSFVTLGIENYVDPQTGNPVSLGFVYVGEPDTDPTVGVNQKTIFLRQENGNLVATDQPVQLSGGGTPTYQGSPVQIVTDGDYSLLVQDKNTAQVYYVDKSINLVDYNLLTVTLSFPTYVELRAAEGVVNLSANVSGRTAAGDGAGGVFYWDASDLAIEVTADPDSAFYVAPDTDLTGATGAWVRLTFGGEITLSSFGDDIDSAVEGSRFLFLDNDVVADSIPIDTPITITGDGEVSTVTLERALFNVIDSVNIATQIEDVDFINAHIGSMPQSVGDDFAAISCFNADNPIIALTRFIDPFTGVRFGYQPGGAICSDGLLIGSTIANSKNIAVENINSKYSRIVGSSIHSDGVVTGTHGVRFSGPGGSHILSATSIRDKTFGISCQLDNENCVVSGVYIENTSDAGIHTTATSGTDGRHNMIGVTVKDTGAEGVDLDFGIGYKIDVKIEDTAGVGLRLSNDATRGRHFISATIKNTGSSAAILASDFNHITLLVDGTTVGTPVAISGSGNVVDVMITDTTTTNTLFITGSNNVVNINEQSTGSVGIRCDGDNNVVNGVATNTLSVVGSGNTFTGSASAVIVSGSDNVFYGRSIGPITDTGSGNNFYMTGARNTAIVNTTTAADGTVVFSHGLNTEPTKVLLTVMQDAPIFSSVTTTSATEITAKFWNSAGAVINTGAIIFTWEASV